MSNAAAERAAIEAIEDASSALRALSLDIHAHPEENYEEHHAHAALTEFFEARGFAVRRGAYGMETAFEAERGGGGARIGILCEYDALPEIGHACGHNLIAIAGAAAGLGAAAALDAAGLEGSVRVLGSPAEEGGGGKIRLIEAGAFEDVGAALMVHPGTGNLLRPPVLAIDTCTVEFTGRNAHAAAAPWEGRNALDALVLAYQAIGLLRQQSQPDVRIHGVIQHGGEKPNIIPDRAAAEFYVRASREGLLDAMCERVAACFRGAAEATETAMTLSWNGPRYSDLASNAALAEVFGRRWAEDEGVRALDLEGPPRGGFGSTDMGDVSHVVPSLHPIYAIEAEAGNHTPQFTVAAATDEAHAATLRAARAMTMTALEWLTDSELRAKAQAAFDAAHGKAAPK